MVAYDTSEPPSAGAWWVTLLVMLGIGLVAWFPELRTREFHFHDDGQLYFIPAIVEIGRQLRIGSLPLLSEYSWQGGALAGEYQPALFSLSHLLVCWAVAGLAPAKIASVVSIGFIALAGGGAYRAARLSGFSQPLALSIASVAALNGFNLAWSFWLTAIASWAWLMWSWWALVRLRVSRVWRWSDVAIAAFCIYSTLTAGWPHIAILVLPVALYVRFSIAAGTSERRAAFGSGCAFVVGGLLSAPALLSLLEFTRESSRSDLASSSWAWTVPLGAMKGLLAPLSSANWITFDAENPHQNLELAGGVVPPLVVAAALLFGDREKRKRIAVPAILGLALLTWAMLPNIPPFRWPFRWLPAVHVLLVVAAAQLLRPGASSPSSDSASRSGAARILGFAGVLGIGLLALIVALEPADVRLLSLALVAGASCVVLLLTRFTKLDASLAFGVCVVANMTATWLSQPRHDATPYWNLARCGEHWAKTNPSDLYFAVYSRLALMGPSVTANGRGGCLAPGNLPMIFQRRFVSGYSGLMPEGLNKVLDMEGKGELTLAGLESARTLWARPGSLLDRWGVTALVVPKTGWARDPHEYFTTHGWQPAEDVADGRIWRRKAAPKLPLLTSVERAWFAPNTALARTGLLEHEGREWMFVPSKAAAAHVSGSSTVHSYAPAVIELHGVTPTRVNARVETSRDAAALVVLRRPYYAGYRATFAGESLEVGRADGVLVAFELPAGRAGKLVIEYAPWGTRPLGILAAAAGVAALLAAFGYDIGRRLQRVRPTT